MLHFSIVHSQPKKYTKLKSNDNYDARIDAWRTLEYSVLQAPRALV